MGGQFQLLRMGALTQPYFGEGTDHGWKLACCAAPRIGRGRGTCEAADDRFRGSSCSGVFARRLDQYALSRPAAVSHAIASFKGLRSVGAAPISCGSDAGATRGESSDRLCSAIRISRNLRNTSRNAVASAVLRMAALTMLDRRNGSRLFIAAFQTASYGLQLARAGIGDLALGILGQPRIGDACSVTDGGPATLTRQQLRTNGGDHGHGGHS